MGPISPTMCDEKFLKIMSIPISSWDELHIAFPIDIIPRTNISTHGSIEYTPFGDVKYFNAYSPTPTTLQENTLDKFYIAKIIDFTIEWDVVG